jgi:hypothetical protein
MPATFYIATTPLSGHTAERRFPRVAELEGNDPA